MCGRYTVTRPERLAERFDATVEDDHEPARYNVAPSQAVPTVVDLHDKRVVMPMAWGFETPWRRDGSGAAPINLRAETVRDKPTFRSALRQHRCLLAADGFYEWATIPHQRAKQPWYFRLRNGELFGFAGLYAPEHDDESTQASCAMITTAPNSLVAPVHNRMPVIVPRDAESLWLDPEFDDVDALTDLLRPYPTELMEVMPVGHAVSSPRNDGPELIAPLSSR